MQNHIWLHCLFVVNYYLSDEIIRSILDIVIGSRAIHDCISEDVNDELGVTFSHQICGDAPF